jgi:SAM-dependent methyltransferase
VAPAQDSSGRDADSREAGRRGVWEERYAGEVPRRSPSAWVLEASSRIPATATIVDIAGGIGRHAVPLAREGRRVVLVDFVEHAVRLAISEEPAVAGVVADVRHLPIAAGSAGAVLVTNFLEREVFPALISLLAPGGVIIYETYTREHGALVEAGLAHAPRCSSFLLDAGELRRLVQPLMVLDYREGQVTDAAGTRCVASVLAIKNPG